MDGNGPFADSRSYPLDVARPNITDGKNSWQIRFQHLRDIGGALAQWFNHCIEIAPGDDESFVVERDATAEPFGSRGCSSHDEDVPNSMTGNPAANVVLPRDAFEVFVTF
jgi:hypothetical protein